MRTAKAANEPILSNVFSPLLTHELVAFGALVVDRLLRAGEKRFAGKRADGSTFQLPNLSMLATCWTSHGLDLAADVFDLYELPSMQ